MQRTDPLIRTKLRMPFIRPSLVPRPRLQSQIAAGLQGPLTLVIAPAGFGKTTLVAASLAGSRLPVAWLSLDQEDNQVWRFLKYLIAALQGADERIGLDATQLMMGMQPATTQAVLTSLINDLDASGGEIVLVLDDYQFISSQEVHAGVTFLLEHCPQCLHLLIATRSDPALPLARLRARGQMIELRAADLRFTPLEAAQFLNEIMGLGLDENSVAVLEDRTEGWVAGLQMAALSMRDREHIHSFVEGFSGTNRHILDYLLEEILAGQTPEIQRFLLYTSILGRLTGPLCDALLDIDEINGSGGGQGETRSERSSSTPSSSILEYLERENLFLVPLDSERTWFRYHHLFADLLKARLHQSQPDRIHGLHNRAADWLEEKGFIHEAIQQLFAANATDRAADLIERYGPERWAESDPSIIHLAENLPPDMLVARPRIGIYQAWHLIILGDIPKALPLLSTLKQSLASASPGSEQHWLHIIASLALAFLARPGSTPAMEPLPDSTEIYAIPAEEPVLRDIAYILYGMSLGRRGELERAAEVSEHIIQTEKTTRGTLATPTMVPFLTRIYLMQGRLHAAASLCREYLDSIKDQDIRFIYSVGSMEIDLGDALYEWNRLEEAEKHVRNGLRANEPWDNIMTVGFGYSALIRILIARGDYSGALDVLDKFETRMQGHSRPREFEEDFLTLRVRIQLAKGELQTASIWADQIQINDSNYQKGLYRLTLAHIRLAQRKYTEVEKTLGEPGPQLVGGSHTRQKLESNLLLAAAAAGQDRLPAALQLIESSLGLAEQEGYIQVFLDVGEPLRELLVTYLSTPTHRHKQFAQKLLRAFPASGRASAPAPQPAGLIEPLSERELEVLQLLALGQTNQDIARQLIISPGTVKAHTASIYRKLDVANRTEAVARARQLGILS